MAFIDVPDSIAHYVSEFKHRSVLVLGDAILDEYLIGDCARISPEAPVPVLKVSVSKPVPGGAANTAANIVSLGGRATLIAMVGDDDAGRILRRCASDAGVDLVAVDHGQRTVRKTRVVARQQQIVRLDYDVAQSAVNESEILRLCDAHMKDADIVIISDYGQGFLSPSVCQGIIQRAHLAGRQVIVDPRPQNRDCYAGCDYLTPNWRESRAFLGLADADPTEDNARDVARTLAFQLATNVVLTLGPQGIFFCSQNGTEHFAVPTVAKEVFDVSGAGDTVVAAFALARASGADHPSAVALANKAAGVVVGKFGTATVTAEEIVQDTQAVRLIPRDALAPLAAMLRARGKRIVTVNGSFDALHGGHLHILNEARQLGDVLVVGLSSDASVKSYNGADRPIVPERQRAEMLLALRSVDYVHIFDEADPIAFLEQLRPDVYVNGSEYGENSVETETVRQLGAKIHTL